MRSDANNIAKFQLASVSSQTTNMVSFQYEEPEPPNPVKGCKSLASTLKDAFSSCNTCRTRLSTSSPEQNYPASDAYDEEEVVVSEIRSRAMEKLKQKPLIITDGISWAFSPKTGELFLNPKAIQQEDGNKDDDNKDDGMSEREEFYSVASCFSCCSSSLSRDAFVSVKTSFSRCSSLNGFEFPDLADSRRRAIIQELCHCEGWPFGLCRKAVMLPPLPKSPSESWSWRKGNRTVKMPSSSVLHYVS